MRLRFGGARADGGPGDELGQVLRHDRIERFGPGGKPSSATYSSSSRASRMPFSMWNESSRSGSLISPFQPTVVRGFSKYTRMTSSSVGCDLIRRAASGARHIRAPPPRRGSSTGPTTTNSRGSRRSRIARTISRERNTVSAARAVSGSRRFTSSGVANRSLESDVDVLQSILNVRPRGRPTWMFGWSKAREKTSAPAPW